MKKYFFGLCVVIFLFTNLAAQADPLTANVIATGEATSGSFGMGLMVFASPALNLHSPIQVTYLYREILLNFTQNSAESLWYSLDGGPNLSVNQATTIIIENGPHTINLYANNSYGTTARSSSFVVNDSLVRIMYSEYFGSSKGNSTNFNDTRSYEGLQSLSSVKLEHTSFGRVVYNAPINLTQSISGFPIIVDLDEYSNISFNRVELDSSHLLGFNDSARVSLFGLSFSNPQILRDGVVCPESICSEVSYAAGTLSFNVTGFSVYSARETPSKQTASATSSTSSGSSGTRPISNETPFGVQEGFSVVPVDLSQKVVPGASVTIPILVNNNLVNWINVSVESKGLRDLLSFDTSSLLIAPRDSISFDLILAPKMSLGEGVFTGSLEFSSEEYSFSLPIAVNTFAESQNYEISMAVDAVSKEALELVVSLKNTKGISAVANLEWFILDSNNRIVYQLEEEATLNAIDALKRSIPLPTDMGIGKYYAYLIIRDDLGTSSQGLWFSTSVQQTFLSNEFFIIIGVSIGILCLLLVLTIIFLWRHKKKKLKSHQKFKKK